MDLPLVANRELLAAAHAGLSARPKTMEPKWFYDERGSALFERITELPEYYPTRTEIAILRDGMDALAGHVPDGAELVELGSGASVKTRLLLDEVENLAAYMPIDISADFLVETAAGLAERYPDLRIAPLVADFTKPLRLDPTSRPRVAFFPGSTLGNLTPEAADTLLRTVRGWPQISAFVLGLDLVKEEEVLVAAYDDAQGVTAAFNRNLLHRMNREIGASFQPETFGHRAVWNAEESRIEMHLESLAEQQVELPGLAVGFAQGETIHTENSRKFTSDGIRALAERTGWRVAEILLDRKGYFAVTVLRCA